MAKKIKAQVKIQIQAGKANPAPPVGTALGPHGINIMDFCKAFNAKTQSMEGSVVPAVITIFQDKSFTFITKVPPVSDLIKKSLNLQKGSPVPHKDKVAKLTQEQLEAIAKQKMPDLNAYDIEMAKNIVAGTARSMGVDVASS
ncbi:MAG: 50S ribosomal protein L11 [Spirochaetia bacterium]|nr:50S ribosomal protein L11 [Spirochaetia bacterium]